MSITSIGVSHAGWPVQASFLRKSPAGRIERVPGRAMSLFQKAVIVYDGVTEVMILNSMYSGEGDLFGCFGPIPSSSRVRPSGSDLFKELDERTGRQSFASWRTGETEEYFRARHGDLHNLELMRSLEEIETWFARNGFDMSKKEREIFGYYLSGSNIFFAALLDYGYPYTGGRVNLWTEPVQTAFPSKRIWFPMKSTTTGDGDHSFVSFDLLTTGRIASVPTHYDTVFRGSVELGHRAYRLTRLEGRLSMAQMEEDLSLEMRPPEEGWESPW